NASRDPEDTAAAYHKEGAESLLAVVAALESESSKAREMQTWKVVCEWFATLLKVALLRGREGDTLDAILDRLGRLSVLDSARVSCDITEFRLAVDRAIRGTTISGG